MKKIIIAIAAAAFLIIGYISIAGLFPKQTSPQTSREQEQTASRQKAGSSASDSTPFYMNDNLDGALQDIQQID